MRMKQLEDDFEVPCDTRKIHKRIIRPTMVYEMETVLMNIAPT